jgi:Zn finger protein HypA/HybF involved in hydrogenase expression
MIVKATCRNCKGQYPAEEFKLHYKLRSMVCPNCYSGKTEKVKEIKKVDNIAKPRGWDVEDEYLERITKAKKDENQAQFTKITGSDYVKCLCAECKFSFRYNPFKKMPRSCPYCNSEVPKLRTFNLL